MKKPAKIKIFGEVFDIVYEDFEDCGLCLYYERTIKINSTVPVQDQARTLNHEIVHAVVSRFDFNNIKLTEEVLTGPISALVRDVYMNNPEVKKFVFG